MSPAALRVGTDPAYVREAAKRGVFASIVDGDADELQSAIEITVQRRSTRASKAPLADKH